MKNYLTIAIVLALAAPALAHDTWVQTNVNIVREGDAVYVDLMLGNHGNDHRDFKLASKIDASKCTLAVMAPDGKSYDLKERLIDTGYAPKEGFWTAKFAAAKPGIYTVAHSMDQVVNHGAPVRAIRSAKCFFAASPSLDKIPKDWAGFDRPLGHDFELVPESNPVVPMGPGVPIKVKLLFKGQPLGGVKISFVPRGETLAEGMDKKYERITDAQGRASFTPTTGNYYLIVAHHRVPVAGNPGYEAIAYAATLTVFVPEICPCCGN